MESQNRMVRNFLNQHVENTVVNQILGGGGEPAEVGEGMDPLVLEEFKHQVKVWWELDTNMKRLSNAMREYRKKQSVLTQRILEFMQKHNIEDLNTRDGVLRCKSAVVKAPLTQKTIRERLLDEFERDPKAVEVLKKVFEERETVPKLSLRRLRI